MSNDNFIFKIIGNRLKFENKGEQTIISWKRMNGFEIALFVLLFMMFIWGTANYFGMKEIMGLQIIPFYTKGLIIYWGIWLLMAVHLFLNRQTTLIVSPYELIFKKRPLIPISRKFDTKNIVKIELREVKNYGESAVGYSYEIYKFCIYFSDGSQLKIDSFNTEDCNQIKKAIQKYLPMEL